MCWKCRPTYMLFLCGLNKKLSWHEFNHAGIKLTFLAWSAVWTVEFRCFALIFSRIYKCSNWPVGLVYSENFGRVFSKLRPTKRALVLILHQGLRNIFGRLLLTSSESGETSATESVGVFGSSLTSHLRHTGRAVAPCITRALQYINDTAAQSDGLFRRPGVLSRVQKLQEIMNSDSGNSDCCFRVSILISSFFVLRCCPATRHCVTSCPDCLVTCDNRIRPFLM